MSNQRYSLDFHSLVRPEAQLLYVTCATSDKDWHSLEHAHSFSASFSLSPVAMVSSRLEVKKYRFKKMI